MEEINMKSQPGKFRIEKNKEEEEDQLKSGNEVILWHSGRGK
jgi:hypothetical protein